MAMGNISKIFIFIIVINIMVMFASNSGLIPESGNSAIMESKLKQLRDEIGNVMEGFSDVSGISILEVFNPLNYAVVFNLVTLSMKFFINPILMFGTLPWPLSFLMQLVFFILEVTAVAGFIRGVAA